MPNEGRTYESVPILFLRLLVSHVQRAPRNDKKAPLTGWR